MNRTRWLVSGLIGLLILGLAAWSGMRWLQGGGLSGGALFGSNSVHLKHSELLPSPEPDLAGIFVRRQDNSLYVGTGNLTFQTVRENDAATPVFEKGYDGLLVEVVLTRQTVLYCDATRKLNPEPVNGQVQQVLEPVDETAITGDRLVWAWGEREGERFVARFIVLFPPPSEGEGC